MARLLISVDADMLGHLPRNLLRTDSDALVVSAGGRSIDTLQDTVDRAISYGFRVYGSCSPKRLAAVRKLPVERVLVDWEPSTVTDFYGDFDWDFDRQLERIALALDDRCGLLVTAVPLNQRKGYAWDYAALSDSYWPVIVQMQGHIKRSPVQRLIDKTRGNTPFEAACATLYVQHGGKASRLARVGFQVALAGDAEVSAQTAAKATRVAAGYGLDLVYVFGMDALALRRYLIAIGRGASR